MRWNPLVLPLAAIGLVGLASIARAADYNEAVNGNAGDLLASAGDTTVIGGILDGIQGSLGTADLFKIYVYDFSLFSATTDDPLTDAGLDTQLFLFDQNGDAVAFNNDISGANLKSALPLGDGMYSGRPHGIYYLGISGSDRDPVSVFGEIFPDATTGINLGSGPGGAGSLTGWTGTGITGNYRIKLTGVGTTPEPGAVATALAFGGALGGLVLRKRRRV